MQPAAVETATSQRTLRRSVMAIIGGGKENNRALIHGCWNTTRCKEERPYGWGDAAYVSED